MRSLVLLATSYLSRRGTSPGDADEAIGHVLREISRFQWSLLAVTYAIIIAVLVLVVYTLEVVFAVACVEGSEGESPLPDVQSSAAPPSYRETDPLISTSANPKSVPEVLGTRAKPVTTSIRRTVRLLTSVGGRWGRYRGFAMSLVWGLATAFLTGIFGVLVTTFISAILARIVLSHWEMTWTHIVVSSPSTKKWYQRLPGFQAWKKIWQPTAITDLITQLCHLTVYLVALLLPLNQYSAPEHKKDEFPAVDMLKLFAIYILSLALYITFIIPANVALIRIQASMLPEDHTTIVPVDRTFGADVQPESQGGNGKLTYRQSWKSISKEVKWRLIKLVAKSVLIKIALSAVCMIAIGVEVALIVVPAVHRARKHEDPSTFLMENTDYTVSKNVMLKATFGY